MLHPKRIRITLARLFTLSLFLLIALLALLFFSLFRSSRNSVVQAADHLRDESSRQLAEKVTSYLTQATDVQESFQSEIIHGVFDPKEINALEAALFSFILTNPNLSEISFTFGEKMGYEPNGDLLLSLSGRGEMSLFRTKSDPLAPIDTRYTHEKEGKWISQLRKRTQENALWRPHFVREAHKAADPTTHLTFITPANLFNVGKNLWSDLHWSQIDKNLPEKERRVEVSVQKTVEDEKGDFLGVLRVGLFQKKIDKITQLKLAPHDPKDPHIVFITDTSGELITNLNAEDSLRQVRGNLRFSSENVSQEVKMSLKDPALRLVDESSGVKYGKFDYNGNTYLVTFRLIEDSRGWILGIVVPQSYYVGPLEQMRTRLLVITSLIILGLSVGGFFLLRSLKVEQAKIISETENMHTFNFKAKTPRSLFYDVYEILFSLELAKTAMRAMSKYVPVALVRRLYQSEKEPKLGGEIQEVSILFTDIRNFTSISEKLSVNELASALGAYLKVMTQVIQNAHQGMIDKYIGDGIMALWNAPTLLPNHPHAACAATLECSQALEKLFCSPEWGNLPRFETRFGIHKDEVMVGHFGAPDRLNFTAIGNGVNVASRLEGLNKQYDTSILASEGVYASAKELFDFRLLDLVAVKGKKEGIRVYELIGKRGEHLEMSTIISQYEEAFDHYQGRNFEGAKKLLEGQLQDGPSRTLHARCTLLLKTPPPKNWDGIFISSMK